MVFSKPWLPLFLFFVAYSFFFLAIFSCPDLSLVFWGSEREQFLEGI